MNLLTGLNSQQQKAITASDGPVLVLAGPGSGKTRVLTHRVAWLVQELDVAPWRIMAVTFTNKAAREMRERLERILDPSRARSLTLGTFHATCARILRREAEAAGISHSYAIFDADDQRRLIKQALRDLDLDVKLYRPQAIHGAISRAKNELIPPEAYTTGSYRDEIVRRVYERYQALLAANDGLDFDDLLMVTVRLFNQNRDVLAKYQERYRHILVDEFQDTNQAQYRLLRQLSGRHHNLFCVADEDQSIYAWRGADYRNIRRLRDDHPDLVTILLEQNYRSTQTILSAAQAVIRHNRDRTDKSLFTQRGYGPKITVHEAYDQDEEARFVVDTIAQLTTAPLSPSLRGEEEGKGVRPSGCAVMYRTNAQSRVFEEAFIRAGMPYRLVGATRFYARREIKDLIAFLRLIHNPSEGVSMARVINVPPRGIGKKTVAVLERAAKEQGVSVYEVLGETSNPESQAPKLGARARRALTSFLELLEGWIAAREQVTVAQLMDRVLDDTRYADYLRDGTEEGEDRWANVLELRNVAADYESLTLTFLQLSAIANPAFDYVALGHMHNQQKIDYPVPVIYPGSLQSIDFGDEEQEKGFYVIQLDKSALQGKRIQSYDFVPVKTRRFLTIKVDADTDDPTETVLHTIANKDVEGAIVRLQVKVPAEKEGLLQESEIRKALKEAYFIAAINKDVDKERRARIGSYSVEAITPIEALKLYFEIKKTSPERVRLLLEYGDRLIREGTDSV